MCEICRSIFETEQEALDTPHQYILPYVIQRFHAENKRSLQALTPRRNKQSLKFSLRSNYKDKEIFHLFPEWKALWTSRRCLLVIWV